MVPYRALAGFFKENPGSAWNSVVRMVEYIERINCLEKPLPYTLGTSGGLKRELRFDPEWMKMIRDNMVPILGWIQYEKVKWLQTNNPEVPGLIYKLAPLDEKMRKLEHVRKLWEGVLEIRPVPDVFTGRSLQTKDYDVDHFVPWSFVMNDELWNLMPMDSSLNASKSNYLPRWDPYFVRFAGNQYMLYEMIQSNSHIQSCMKAVTGTISILFGPSRNCTGREIQRRSLFPSCRRT